MSWSENHCEVMVPFWQISIDQSNECNLYHSSTGVMIAMLPHLDVDPLKTFLAIADTGSFTRAAEDVNKTQSAVSMQMKRLEETLGRPLFSKEGRGVRFTRDGERLIDYARRIVALSDEAVATFTKPDLTGTVRFGTPDDYAEFFLPVIIARFARTHPLVTVEVECLPSAQLTERVARGEVDIATVTFGCITENADVLRQEELVWATSERHNVHLNNPLPIAVSHAGCCWRQMMTQALDSAGRNWRVAYASPNASTINAAVLQGLAVATMPAICLRPGMRVLTERDGFPSLGTFDIGVIYKPGRRSPAVEALAHHIREGLTQTRFNMEAA
jgi:DNA-binding transcriptional LysR family regulator